MRTARRCAPTSTLGSATAVQYPAHPSRDFAGFSIPFEPSVNFSYHARSPVPTPSEPPCPRSRPSTAANSKRSGCRSRRIASSRRIRACSRARRACTTGRADGRQVLDGCAGLWCVNAGHGRKEITEAVSEQIADDGVRAAVPDGASRRVRARERRRAVAARRSRSRVLRELRVRGRRHGAQDRARLSPRARRRHAHAPDRSRARLSRRRLRRHLRRRHGQQPQVLRRRSCPASITCRTRTTSHTTRTRAASPRGARTSPTSSSASWRCTTRAPSRP